MGEQLIALGSTWGWCAAGLAPFRRGTGRVAAAAGTTRSRSRLLGALAGAEPVGRADGLLAPGGPGYDRGGVRAIPVGHTHGQQVLAYLQDDIRDLAADLVDRDPETAGAGCPFYEVLCDEQTRLYARMFRS